MVEAVQTYVNLVAGLSRVTLATARAAARGVLGQVGLQGVADDAERRVNQLAEEIVEASRANRQLLENVVAAEVTKAASGWGFVRSEDLDEVREEIAELRSQLARRDEAERPPGTTVAAGSRGSAPSPGADGTPLVPDPAADAGA